jgi:hypothetical protein
LISSVTSACKKQDWPETEDAQDKEMESVLGCPVCTRLVEDVQVSVVWELPAVPMTYDDNARWGAETIVSA